MELRWTGNSGRTRGGEIPHSFPHFVPFSRRSGLSSTLGWDWGSLFVSGRMNGRAWDACVSRFPACSHYRWTKRGPSIGPSTTHGPWPYPKHYLTSGQGIFSGSRSYLRNGNHRTCQMRGFGASLFSPFELSISAFETRLGPEDSAFLSRWRRIGKSCLPMKIRVFAWLLLFLTRSLRQHMIPDALAECALCAGAEEDCEYLFVTCSFASSVW